MSKKIKQSYYLQEDVVALAKDLIGKVLITTIDGILTSGIITETEAYAGVSDKASHAFGGRRTARTETMYARGGTAYVYLCYGIHSLFNIVTNAGDVPHAVLIRAIKPLEGIEHMEKRRNKSAKSANFTGGPGTVSQALGIHFSHSGLSLNGKDIYLEDHGYKFPKSEIKSGPRIGVDYAGEDAKLPYRFYVSPKYQFS
ncbi:DNA-3-methyladenine glycosylase [soil metagenome]